MIGLSFSFCVRDIAFGDVKYEDVEKIICSCSARTPEDWDGVILRYQQVYWREMPSTCETIARGLIGQGKVFQPKMSEGWIPSTSAGCWVESEDQIQKIDTTDAG